MVLKFTDVIGFQITPLAVEGLKECRYPIRPWAFNEILDSEEASLWKALRPRFWLISFNDLTIEILFETVSIVGRDPKGGPQHKTLINALPNKRHPMLRFCIG